jgi:hypothetical protein
VYHELFHREVDYSTIGFGQQTGTIEGTLLDQGGASVPNAKVEAFDEARQVLAREAVTASDGVFYFDTDDATLGYGFNRGREYGPAGFDRTHTLTVDYVYELPRFER